MKNVCIHGQHARVCRECELENEITRSKAELAEARGTIDDLRAQVKRQAEMLKAQSEPAAWRVQVGDSDIWGYIENESDADFHGKQSGLKYKKQCLYTTPQPSAEDAKDAARYRWLKKNCNSGLDVNDDKPQLIHLDVKFSSCNWEAELDAAIDAARGEGK